MHQTFLNTITKIKVEIFPSEFNTPASRRADSNNQIIKTENITDESSLYRMTTSESNWIATKSIKLQQSSFDENHCI